MDLKLQIAISEIDEICPLAIPKLDGHDIYSSYHLESKIGCTYDLGWSIKMKILLLSEDSMSCLFCIIIFLSFFFQDTLLILISGLMLIVGMYLFLYWYLNKEKT